MDFFSEDDFSMHIVHTRNPIKPPLGCKLVVAKRALLVFLLQVEEVVPVCVCVSTPVPKGSMPLFPLPPLNKAGGPWAHGWHGPTKTHPCCRENVPAGKLLSKLFQSVLFDSWWLHVFIP